VTWAGAIAPGIIVLGLMTYNTYVSVDLEEPPTEPGVVVAVDAYQWWWRVEYPELGFVTANEVNVPVGQPLVVRLYSADVIHSFWVPQLQGKRDLMPDFQGTMWMQADRAGAYRGQCAEFCGLQHAKMQFLVIAHEQQEWEAWLQAHQQPPAVPTSGQAFRGLQVFLGSECVYCHTVRGTNATGTLGPDLTDLATRRELGAGTVLNTRGNLAAWIIDSQRLKPGNKMPPMPMPGPDLVDLLAYMETLR
jgi:cytochrome c oxidase subunit 2